MDYGGPHVVVPVGRPLCVLTFLEYGCVAFGTDPNMRREGMRFRNFINGF
jgi:hypothetical protein